jgi:hypothetical protein
VSTYRRKKKEIVDKIKMADGIAYVKSNAPQPVAQGEPHRDQVSPPPLKKSRPKRLVLRKEDADAIFKMLGNPVQRKPIRAKISAHNEQIIGGRA